MPIRQRSVCTMTTTGRTTPRVALIGDSDIAYWPSDLYPTIEGTASLPTIASGHSGATLAQTLPHLRDVLSSSQQHQKLILVACAGENDIGEGISLDSSVSALETFIEIAFDSNLCGGDASSSNASNDLIFLGPKFEPWLNDDPISKKKYAKMSRSFERCCQRSVHSQNIYYVDCITMFCGETANVPGAVLGGNGKAEYKYFIGDHLHLSSHGYKIWKDVVEKHILEHIYTRAS